MYAASGLRTMLITVSVGSRRFLSQHYLGTWFLEGLIVSPRRIFVVVVVILEFRNNIYTADITQFLSIDDKANPILDGYTRRSILSRGEIGSGWDPAVLKQIPPSAGP